MNRFLIIEKQTEDLVYIYILTAMFFYSIKSYLAAIEDFKTYTRHIVCVFRLLFLIQLFSTTISIYVYIYRSTYATYKKIQGENQ